MLQRETSVFDLFIAVKVREDVWADESEFHLEREETFKDLFDLNQPRARLEDLVRGYGVKEGIVKLGTSASRRRQAIPFASLSVSFSPRSVGLLLVNGPRTKRTIVQVVRESRNERLEVTARRLVRELKEWVKEGGS